MKLNPTRGLAVIGAALVLMVGGAVAYASIPSADGTITGCVNKASGLVRIIDTAKESCKSTETTVPWNQAGQPGTNGVSGYETVVRTRVTDVGIFFSSLQATCPTGKKVTGGGAGIIDEFGGSSPDYDVDMSHPTADNTGWFAIFDVENPSGRTYTLSVYAICATVTP